MIEFPALEVQLRGFEDIINQRSKSLTSVTTFFLYVLLLEEPTQAVLQQLDEETKDQLKSLQIPAHQEPLKRNHLHDSKNRETTRPHRTRAHSDRNPPLGPPTKTIHLTIRDNVRLNRGSKKALSAHTASRREHVARLARGEAPASSSTSLLPQGR